MKYILLLTLASFIYACSSTEVKYFHGHIYSTNKQPLNNLKVVNQYDNSINSITDKNGYFKIPKEKKFKGRYLHIYNKGNKIDSIPIVSTHPERKPTYYFVNGRKDTLYITLPNNGNK
ncbi:hypothetical protein [Tenacibaculum maritimum]|uniref:Lipoprotein n=1 Tax=Tenacibaculum maritimum NCIMB 2154 TaxID=1349785 RepID=A0A2H1E724_9FLAO|nr:hypothetical protein [Tenacibaculum maritimum]MCD9564369.1 hypothetical protein [Tenacibaculum maritimum]MCD9567135.1 hypothetical protein [Tenacibaculum maritimum]MCD9580399.1 hypothetical protein [Tenacibaculum maritimum]MCD9583452.1 hypothetical protein [Tenacibaculum maritimum]MCD9583952.1 hypothetical protein [Tenacibaculum maritimum]